MIENEIVKILADVVDKIHTKLEPGLFEL